jgi:SAM-dependent methyltransferase
MKAVADRAALNKEFLREYSSEKSIRKYTRETAGNGITYLLHHDYGKVYSEILKNYIPESRKRKGIRVLEFGCGGGMNLLHLVTAMNAAEARLGFALGADFSETLVKAAEHEASAYLSPEQNKKVRFCVARNESLIGDLSEALSMRGESLIGSFDLILGVNTIRYCHRMNKQDECVRAIFDLLTDGGVCIIIDMNNKFPAFRSRLADRLTKEKRAYYLPTLDEYARPFSSAGFEILRKDNFCWVPHSAGAALTRVMKTLTPVLSSIAPRHAMRSLVVSRKIQRQSS